jgi:dolichol-phosphate mannosyltransferase
MKKVSIVIPIYNESNLSVLVPRLFALKDKLPNNTFEFIFVDDGSEDKSLEDLLNFRKKYPNEIKVIKLSRNFGSMAARQAGLTVSTGDCVGVISSDLQDPPELFVEMIEHWEKGVKGVLAVRKQRNDSFSSRILSKLYYFGIRQYALPNFPKGGFDFFLIDRQVVDELNKNQEKNSNLMNLLFWLGFDYVTIPYVRQKRNKGKSGWTLSKKFKHVIDSFIGFSYVPIKLLPIIGTLFSIVSFVYGASIFYNWIIGDVSRRLDYNNGHGHIYRRHSNDYAWSIRRIFVENTR